MSIAIALHTLAATLWVGGMFFAYMCARPAAAVLDTPQRLQLWVGMLGRFFPWVWGCVAVLLGSGFYLFFNGVRGFHVHLMMGAGILMMLVAAHVYFAPFKRLRRHVAASDWSNAAIQLNQTRMFLVINICLGVFVIVAASAGHYGFS